MNKVIKKRVKEKEVKESLSDLRQLNSRLTHTELTDDELIHYGVKGMRWGVRRYQNPDGSLTAKGRARQRGESTNRFKQVKENVKVRSSRMDMLKNKRTASDDDLRNMINRLKTEAEFTKLVQKDLDPGRAWINENIPKVVGIGLGAAAGTAGARLAKHYLKKKYGI